jgi:hypothetical protein
MKIILSTIACSHWLYWFEYYCQLWLVPTGYIGLSIIVNSGLFPLVLLVWVLFSTLACSHWLYWFEYYCQLSLVPTGYIGLGIIFNSRLFPLVILVWVLLSTLACSHWLYWFGHYCQLWLVPTGFIGLSIIVNSEARVENNTQTNKTSGNKRELTIIPKPIKPVGTSQSWK